MAMVYPMQSDEADRKQKLLSNHIETWGPQRTAGDGWSQLSMDSSEMGDLASPFDDIGFLAGGPGPSMDPPSPKRSTEKSRNVAADQVSSAAPPSLGKFLDTKQPKKIPIDDQSRLSSLSQRGSKRRLDKTLSTRQQFQHDEEASLALSVAMAAGDKSKANPSRHLFDFSKQSLGLSALAPSKSKPKTIEASKSSFDTSRTLSTKSSTKGNDSSKGSFGFGGASRTSEGTSRKLGSKFSSMMRSKNETDKLSKSEQKVSTLEAENVELNKEINLLQAKMEEMANVIAVQTLLKDWRSTEELAAATTEAWQYRSMAIAAEIQLERLEAKIASQDRLIEAKERSICNLERVRQDQEKRIGYLEMQCLQNGIDIAEDGDCAHVEEDMPLKSGYSAGSRSDTNEGSFASFHDEEPFQAPIEVPISIPCPPQRSDHMSRSNRSESSHKEKDLHGRSSRSECSSSMCLSEMSFHSQSDDESVQPESQRDVDDYPSTKIKAVPLEKYLSTNVPKEHCFETGTWDPTKNLDFAHSSPRDVAIVMPPPPPPPTADHVNSAPAPSNRKTADGTVVSRSSRSKSPGTRRRLKGARVESDSDLPAQSARRSKSPRARRKLKDPTTAAGTANSVFPPSSTLEGSVTEHCKVSRRKLKTQKSDIGASSTHSLSRGSAHRRRQRKDSEFDRSTVSSALERALGASMNVLDMDDDFATMQLPDNITGVSKVWKREAGIMMVQSKASRESDIGLDLDDVYRD